MTEHLAKMSTDFTIDNGQVIEKRGMDWFMGSIQHHCLDELIRHYIPRERLLSLTVGGISLYRER